MTSISKISTPKRKRINSRSEESNFYDFYASYTDSFAIDVIRNLTPNPDSIVLDPWNGSGTTTFAAGSLGFKAVGLDINPTMVLIAKARLSNLSQYRILNRFCDQIRNSDLGDLKLHAESDSLTQWFDNVTAARLRVLQNLLGLALPRRSRLPTYVESLPVDKSLRYVSLFKLVRILTKGFVSSNPTWVRLAKSSKDRLSYTSEQLLNAYREVVKKMYRPTYYIPSDVRKTISILCADSREVQAHVTEQVGCIVTSPPYCTRIDYPVQTRRELAILGISDDSDFRELREGSIGTPLMISKNLEISQSWGPTCGKFLESVRMHESKASASYYLKVHLQYFESLCTVLDRSFELLSNGARCAIVVQGSYYKGIHNNLPQIVIEMASTTRNMRIVDSIEFRSSSRYRHNPHARKRHPQSPAAEHILFFEKQDYNPT